MKTFTIENDSNNIIVHTTIQEAEAVTNAERFRNEGALAKLAANWPAARLVDIWNSLPGAPPVRKFKDRATAVNRIWKAIQSLGEIVPATEESAPEESAPIPEDAAAPDVAVAAEPEVIETVQPQPESTEPAAATPIAPQTPDAAPEQAPAKTRATRARKAPVAATNAGAPREGSKTSQVIEMLKRDGGVTLEELMAKFQWQAHTTRSMLSAGGSLVKKHGLVITSEKIGDRRVYAIKA